MKSISLCMIVKNEEAVIERCLQSVSDLVDEIIIVDTGSTDQTKEICSKYTKQVFDFEWIDDFAAARNYSFAQASADYILWLDADDVIKEADQGQFQKLCQTLNSEIDAVSMLYHLAFDSENHPTSSLRRYRLVKSEKGFKWVGAVHEYLAVNGNLYESEIAICHLPLSHDADRNIRIYERMLDEKIDFTPRDLFYYANELVDHGQAEKAIEYYQQFLSTKKGWLEDNLRACYKLSDCFYQLGKTEEAIGAVLHTLILTSPRAEACCRLGFSFMEKEDFQSAAYWYEQALANKDGSSAPFYNPSFSTWLPHLQLAVCYDKLGDTEKANEHNQHGLACQPNDERLLANQRYFKDKLQMKNKHT
ncbi:tetratricopeptide repeat-containing glycosyltransferase family 2 protein [Cytobacillus gottheilii]|uniref:tetratricopeptide repeat-containing glycosyltransferase family 2 protein n=1 Tax=Cytobacillus gottheilii TaxID=859144 RepID=UPI0009B9A483|nr:glycosyltransferase family 2 protein [Cytobacillus gottheilii]